MQVVILVGLPGSGKSTWIKNNTFGDVTVCSSDHWHETRNGYVFKPEEHGYGHHACLRKFVQAITQAELPHVIKGPKTLIVDNTNVEMQAIAPYVNLATAYGYIPEVIYLECPIEVSKRRNTHKVPESVIDSMHYNLNQLLVKWPSIWRPITTVPFDTSDR